MKNIRKILTVLLIAMLFVSCNADMKEMGILNTIKHSKPDTSFDIMKVSGSISNQRYLIETEDGIDVYNVSNNNRTNLVRGLNATLKFTKSETGKNTVFYTTNEVDNVTYSATVNGDFESTSDQKVVTFKADDITFTVLESSFFEGDHYIILAKADNGNYYFIMNPSNGEFNADGTCYTFKDTLYEVTDKATSPVYLGNGYYYVDQKLKENNFFQIYKIDGTKVNLADNSIFSTKPIAVEGDYLFASEGLLYKINGTTITQVSKDKKHSITYLKPNTAAPMVAVGSTVYGVANGKPFTVSGDTFTETDYIADIHVIDLYYSDGTFYAFSDKNGVYTSTDGKTYKYN